MQLKQQCFTSSGQKIPPKYSLLLFQVQNKTKKAQRVEQEEMNKEIEILVDLMDKAKNYSMREDLMVKAKNYSIIAVGDLTKSEGKGEVLEVVNNIMDEIVRRDQIESKPVAEKSRRKRMRKHPRTKSEKVQKLSGGQKHRRRVLKKRPVTAKGLYWKARLARNPKNVLTDAIYR